MDARISIDPTVCHGKPVFRGTRVLVAQVLGALGAGDSREAVLEDYPSISSADIDSALEFASRMADFQSAVYEPAL